ncbi:MAG: hypothetical protein ACRC2V_07415, partial [Xenococcaceae cyanobacterium]
MLELVNGQWEKEAKPFVPLLNNGAEISHPVVEIDSLYSISQIKESSSVNGSAVIGEVGGLTAISVTGGGDSVSLSSLGTASINGGQWARVSISVKVDSANLPQGNKKAFWGIL